MRSGTIKEQFLSKKFQKNLIIFSKANIIKKYIGWMFSGQDSAKSSLFGLQLSHFFIRYNQEIMDDETVKFNLTLFSNQLVHKQIKIGNKVFIICTCTRPGEPGMNLSYPPVPVNKYGGREGNKIIKHGECFRSEFFI